MVVAKEFFEKWEVGKVCEVARAFLRCEAVSKRQLGAGGYGFGIPGWVKGWDDISGVLKVLGR